MVLVGGTVDDKVGEDDERDARESTPQPGRRLRGGKVTCYPVSYAIPVGKRDVERQDERRREGNEWEGRQMDRRKGEWGRQ